MDAVLLAVLNALWQGAALIALVALALRTGLRRNATTACVVWSITFAVVALLPAIDLALARPASAPLPVRANMLVTVAPPALAATHVERGGLSAAPRADRYHVTYAPRANPAGDPLAARRESAAQWLGAASMRVGTVATAFARSWGIALIGAWAFVAGALLLRLALAYLAVARMKGAATPLDRPLIVERLRAAGHRRRASVARSSLIEIPCAIGFRHPMILVPATLADTLDTEDLARIVLHESAHLQRYDDWINALEQFVCALQFFQPALYVARRSIDFEREVACDDRVLEDSGEPLRYAECLARIVQRHVRGRQASVVPGFVVRRTQVVARVRCIVDRSRDASPHLRVGAVLLGAVMLVATLGIAQLQVPLVAPAFAEPVPKAAPAAAAPAAPVFVISAPPVDLPAAPAPKARVIATVPRQAASPAPTATPTPAPSPYVRAQRLRTYVLPELRRLRIDEVNVTPPAGGDSIVMDERIRLAPRVRAITAEAVAAATAVRVAAPYAARTIVRVVADAPEASRAATAVRFGRSGGDMLDAIDEAKYPHPSVDELIALRNQGVTGDYIRRMGALGRSRPSLHDLMTLATQGVTPEYVATLDRRLAAPPTLDDVLSLRAQGVSASWLDGLAAAGYPKLSAGDAASLAVQGVSAAYVRALLEAGLRNVTPAQLAALRVQGVDGSFVRRLAQHGYRNVSIDEIVRLKVSGFEP